MSSPDPCFSWLGPEALSVAVTLLLGNVPETPHTEVTWSAPFLSPVINIESGLKMSAISLRTQSSREIVSVSSHMTCI